MIRFGSERERQDVEETQRLLSGEGGVSSIAAPLTLAEELDQRRAQAEPHPFSNIPMPNIQDVETMELARQLNPLSPEGIPLRQISCIRVRLGKIPVLPDLRQEPTADEIREHRRRESESRAGHCGPCGTDWP